MNIDDFKAAFIQMPRDDKDFLSDSSDDDTRVFQCLQHGGENGSSLAVIFNRMKADNDLKKDRVVRAIYRLYMAKNIEPKRSERKINGSYFFSWKIL